MSETDVADGGGLLGQVGDVKSIFKSLTRNKDFMKLFWGQLISSTGDWIATLALMSLVYKLTNSSLAVGGMLAFRIIPALLSGPLAAVISDRMDRKRILISCDIIRGGIVLAIPLLHTLWALYALLFVLEGVSIIWLAARDASIPNLVTKDELTMANSLSMITTYAVIPVAAVLFSLLTIPSPVTRHFITGGFLAENPTILAFMFDAITFFTSAIIFSQMRLKSPHTLKENKKEKAPLNIKSSLMFSLKDPFARSLLMAAAVGCIGGGSLYAVGIGYVKEVLGAKSDVAFGFLMALFGIGMITGVVALQLLVKHAEKPYMLRISLLTMGGIMVGMALVEWLPLAYLLAGLFGASFGIMFLVAVTMVQERISDEDRGKAFSAFHAISRIFLVLGAGLSGAIAWLVSTREFTIFGITRTIHGVSLALLISGVMIASVSIAPMGEKKERYRDYFVRPKNGAAIEPSDSVER
ncbi:MAG: MFS transporter [Actinobacteria bacterium]|nr:MFS transporter [Actinomycetota bacterium]